MTEREAMVRAVCEQPGEDTVRLAFADWCDEHGEPERAEFVRVQVELARIGPKPRELFVADGAGARMEGLGVALIPRGGGHYSASSLERGLSTETFAPGERVDIYAHLARKDRIAWMRGLKYVKHVDNRHEIIFRKDDQSGPWKGAPLAKRADELLSAHGREWVNGVIPGAMPSNWSPHNPTPYLVLPGPSFGNVEFSRGFVSEVTCTLADWLAHGPAIVKAHPVTRVVLGDREPAVGDYYASNMTDGKIAAASAYWLDLGTAKNCLPPRDERHWIPGEITKHMTGYTRYVNGLYYPTRANAIDALSDACVAWGRNLAGLSPLRKEVARV